MAQFQYKAKQGPEKIIEGVIDASSEMQAIEKITQMGYMPISVDFKRGKSGKSSVEKFSSFRMVGSGKKNSRVGSFSRYLANLSKSGLPLFRCIELLADIETELDFKQALTSIKKEISRGKALSQAMALHPSFFSSMYVAMIRAGEAGGDLRQGLVRMADYLRKQEELASKIRRAMVYPALLIVAGLGSVFFILSFAVPKFSRVFQDLGKSLPLSTQIVVATGSFFEKTWFLILPLTFFIFFGLPKIFPQFFGYNVRQRLALKVPGLRRLLIQAGFSRFIRALDLCMSNGMVFVEAIKTAIPVVDHAVLEESLFRAHDVVEKGGSFGQALKSDPFFAGISAEMICIGEESGNLPEVLREMADTYDREIDEAVSYMITLLEPLMILIVGAVVAFIVISLLLPVFEINTAF